MVSDKKIHRAFRTHITLLKKTLEKFLIFTIYQNYTLALILCIYMFIFLIILNKLKRFLSLKII